MLSGCFCSACGVELTREERHYYECRCEDCERDWLARVEAWRHGAPDAELDDLTSPTRPRPTIH